MNKKELEAFSREAAKSIKTEKDLCDFSQMLTKIAVETTLSAELDDHLGYNKHQPSSADNSRNGYSRKTLIIEDGSFSVDIPRDRAGDFEPQLVKKHQTCFTSMDDKIHCLYAKGMTTREIVATFKEMYDADVSASLISKVTDAVIEQVIEWQSRLPHCLSGLHRGESPPGQAGHQQSDLLGSGCHHGRPERSAESADSR